MSDNEPMPSATPIPPISSSAGAQSQDTLLMRGALDAPFTPGTVGRLDRFEVLRLSCTECSWVVMTLPNAR